MALESNCSVFVPTALGVDFVCRYKQLLSKGIPPLELQTVASLYKVTPLLEVQTVAF